MQYLYAFLVLSGCILLFILIYVLNAKTKKPDGCDEPSEECEGCKVTLCRNNPQKKDENKEIRK